VNVYGSRLRITFYEGEDTSLHLKSRGYNGMNGTFMTLFYALNIDFGLCDNSVTVRLCDCYLCFFSHVISRSRYCTVICLHPFFPSEHSVPE
jgi:hypothetical protein